MKKPSSLLLLFFTLLLPHFVMAVVGNQAPVTHKNTTANFNDPTTEGAKLKSTNDRAARKLRKRSRRALIFGILGIFIPPLAILALHIGIDVRDKAAEHQGEYYHRTKTQAEAARRFGKVSLIVFISVTLGFLTFWGLATIISNNSW